MNHYIATSIHGVVRHLLARNEIDAMKQAKEIGMLAPSIELVESKPGRLLRSQETDDVWQYIPDAWRI